jgi:hypothetical protein
MTSVFRSELIYITSANRISGNTHDFNLNLDDTMVKAEKNQKIKVIAVDASINRSWYTIDTTNNFFTLYEWNPINCYFTQGILRCK